MLLCSGKWIRMSIHLSFQVSFAFLNPKLNYRIKFESRFEHCSMRNDIAQLMLGKHKVVIRKFI